MLILFDDKFPPERGPVADRIRCAIEAAPWATVIARGRWATLLVDLTVRHLHLCLRGALLIDPQIRTVSDGRRVTLCHAPLAYPTVLLTDRRASVADHAKAWKSSLITRDPRRTEVQNIDAALSLLGVQGDTTMIKGMTECRLVSAN